MANRIPSIITSNNFRIITVLTVLAFGKINVQSHVKIPGVIYILYWTPYLEEINDLPCSQYKAVMKPEEFSKMRCRYQNCHLTSDQNYFIEITDFDAVLFDSVFTHRKEIKIPDYRSDDQTYIFVSRESSANYPVRHNLKKYDNFFNYTWTYKLNSDIPFHYVVVRNRSDGRIVAPKANVDWITTKDMKLPMIDKLKDILYTKYTAAASYLSDCSGDRYRYAKELKKVLNYYDLKLNLYDGNCKNNNTKCVPQELLEGQKSNHFFYLSFESADSEDYVTEQLLIAIDNFAIPVVLGGADYWRFMPKGAYIDAGNLDEEVLGRKMSEIINDHNEFFKYFKWHRYYSYHDSAESADTNPHCALCAFLNGDWKKKRRVYAEFTNWWNENHQAKRGKSIMYFNAPKTRFITNNGGLKPDEKKISLTEIIVNILNKWKDYFFG